MIIGNGLLAKSFFKFNCDYNNIVIFASGVSNSTEIREYQFKREENLLSKVMEDNLNKLVIYFSSCALINKENLKIPYYNHKYNMETLVKKHDKFIIIRLPQVIGFSNNTNTIVNFFIKKIINNEEIILQKDAFRYFVDIDDILNFVKIIVSKNLNNNFIVDFANPYKYSIYEIIKIISELFNKKYTNYSEIIGGDNYDISFEAMNMILGNKILNFDFGMDYLYKKIKNKYIGENK